MTPMDPYAARVGLVSAVMAWSVHADGCDPCTDGHPCATGTGITDGIEAWRGEQANAGVEVYRIDLDPDE